MSFVQDDDGFLVAHMALAHCARGEGLGLSLPTEKSNCVSSVQVEVPYDDKISPYSFSPTVESKVSTIAKIRETCGFDYMQAWAEARAARNGQAFACEEMKSVIEKAAARSKEYLKEQMDPANLASIDGPKSTIARYVTEVRESDAALQAIAVFFKSPRTKGEFYSLTETFKKQAEVRAYQVTNEATSDINPALQKPFLEVASLLNIAFPDPDAPQSRGPIRVGRTRCGGAPLPTVPEALAGLEWQARSAGVRPIGGERDQNATPGAE